MTDPERLKRNVGGIVMPGGKEGIRSTTFLRLSADSSAPRGPAVFVTGCYSKYPTNRVGILRARGARRRGERESDQRART